MGEYGQIGSVDGLHGAWVLLVDKATRDNFQNMTLAEIDALKQKKMQELDNMTLAKIEALKQDTPKERENMTLFGEMPIGNFGRWQDEMRSGSGKCNFGPIMSDYIPKRSGGHLGWLPDDVSKDKLNNMTLSEIRNLRIQNMQKLQNMTIAEIGALKQKRSKSKQI